MYWSSGAVLNIIVCGAGQVGFNIAQHLSGEGSDVTVVDHAEEQIRRVGDSLDVQTIAGYASHPDVLEQSGAQDADMLIAVTQSDEINMVSCQVAHSLFNVPMKIARVRTPAYLAPAWADLFSRDHIPIDVLISPEAEVVNAISRRLEVPGTVDMRGFADDRVRLVGVRITENCPIVHTPMRQLTELFPSLNITIVYIVRQDTTIIPTGMDQMLPGDEVYFVVETDHMTRALATFGHEEKEARRLVIVGGGHIGLDLARHLEQSESSIEVKLVEVDREQAELVADQLEKTIVLHGDALDSELLDEANIASSETIVAVSSNDETNILVSVLAKRHGCPRAITLINAAEYAPLISPLGIDAAVSPREITVSSILEHVRQGRIRSVYALRGGEAEVIEAEAMETSPIVGQSLKSARLPRGVLLGAIVRGDQVIIPRGDTTVKSQDRVILFAPHDSVKKVERLFSVALGFF